LLSDLLIAKRQEGVAVNIIYDSYRSDSTAADLFVRLTAAGIAVLDSTPSTRWTLAAAIPLTTGITARC
jgi:hypothetical protein